MKLKSGTRTSLPRSQQQNMTESEQGGGNATLENRVAHLETRNTELQEQLGQTLQNLQAATAAATAASNAATAATTRNNNQTLNMNVYNSDLFINNTEDKKLWLKATTDEPKVLYDLSNKNFDTFLASVREKVGDYVLNRNDNFSVPISVNGQIAQMKLLLDHYGECTSAEVRHHAVSIWLTVGTNGTTNIVENQDTLRRSMAYKVIRNMLTPEAKKIMLTKSTKYMFGEHGDGPCLFKAIVEKVQPSTTMSIKALKNQLRDLSLHKYKHNVKEGTQAFNKIVEEINRQGEEIKESDLFVDLFRFLKTSTNQHFIDYARRMEDDITDKKVKYNFEEVITLLETKYTDLKFDNAWDVVDKRDQQILAMKTILENLMSPKNESADDKKKRKKKREWKGEWAKPPENNETEKNINGKDVKWCQKCNDGNGGWTTTHFTDGHTAPTYKGTESQTNNTKLKLNDDLKAAMMTLNLDTQNMGLN